MAKKSGKRLTPITVKPKKITKIAKQFGSKKIAGALKTGDAEVMRALEKAKSKAKATKKSVSKKLGVKKPKSR